MNIGQVDLFATDVLEEGTFITEYARGGLRPDLVGH
jgi:hypothetical protein